MISKSHHTLLGLIVLAVIPFFTYAQSALIAGTPTCLRAIYRLDYKIDSAVTAPKSERMILRISNSASCFRSYAEYVNDSPYFTGK